MSWAATILIGIVGSALANELDAWSPHLIRTVIAIAVRCAPASYRERFQEEWTAHVEEIPGKLARLIVAADFIRSAATLSARETGLFNIFEWPVLSQMLALALMFLLLPLNLTLALLLRTEQSQIYDQVTVIGNRGRKLKLLVFRTFERVDDGLICSSRCASFLLRNGLNRAPMVFNLLKGDLALVGPTPRRMTEIARLGSDQALYMKSKPGIANILLANGYSSVASWDRDEVDYMRNRTFLCDVTILLRCATKIFFFRS